MIWFIYNILFTVGFLILLPHFLLRMKRRGGYARHFWERVAKYKPAVAARLKEPGHIWIQAVSVGEIYLALGFMDQMRRRRPGTRFVLSTTTSTAHAIAEPKLSADDVLIYFPADFPFITRRALDRIKPRALILIENELWPNLVRLTRQRDIPVVLVNGRISEHSYRGYRMLRAFTRRLLPLVNLFCVQSAGDAQRLKDLGAPEERLCIVGSAKYDLNPPAPPAAELARAVLRAAGIPEDARVLLGGSTWPGEEAVLLDLYRELKPEMKDLVLVLVPRHVERSAELLAEIEQRGLKVLRRTALKPGSAPAARPDVLLVDTTGELMRLYSCASVIFVGKSLTVGGGQNIIEPAWWGKPVLVGPHMKNFPVVVEDFREADAFIQVPDAAGLKDAVIRLLNDPARRVELAARAARLVREKSGAGERTLDRIAPVLFPG
ncbi:MAG: 3-deoxy-D-manno-octulosonic acid transferase [Verrucomicrobia bacterium]|nr:3-deoxy-D-manno-octulosonic acid transferase [Verrucomicrobiota bacterium]MBU1909336.1 3-deoxy-D-manno-octulosonic acid transferase [Verrucomicrobiota bacterium]